jgi:hypothetical protein
LEIEPANPFYLDRLLEVCILLGQNRLAAATLDRLEEVDPNNQALSERRKQVKAMPSRRLRIFKKDSSVKSSDVPR